MGSESITEPFPSLFPGSVTRERIDDFLTRELAAAQQRVTLGSVMPTLDMAQFRQELAEFDFEIPRPPQNALTWIIRQLEHGAVHMTQDRKSVV